MDTPIANALRGDWEGNRGAGSYELSVLNMVQEAVTHFEKWIDAPGHEEHSMAELKALRRLQKDMHAALGLP